MITTHGKIQPLSTTSPRKEEREEEKEKSRDKKCWPGLDLMQLRVNVWSQENAMDETDLNIILKDLSRTFNAKFFQIQRPSAADFLRN